MKPKGEPLTVDNLIIAVSPLTYHNPPILIASIPQDKNIVTWLEHNLRSVFNYQGKRYLLSDCILDVVEYDIDLIKATVDYGIKISSSFFIRDKIREIVRCEPPFLPNDCGAKGIFMVLVDKEQEESLQL